MGLVIPDGRATGDFDSIDELIESMERIEKQLDDQGDQRRFFHSTYLRTTKAVRDEVRRGGFEDNAWVERWDLVFAGLYLRAFEEYEATGNAPGPWPIAFETAADRSLPPLRHVLLGMNAHINYDLAQALVAVIGPDEFGDAALIERRGRDHRHIDSVLAARVAAEDDELKKVELPGQRTMLDRLLTPFNRLGTKRFLAESRAKVWHNARVLNEARAVGEDTYSQRLDELSNLSRARVRDLGQPGQVILQLARKGFGVKLA